MFKYDFNPEKYYRTKGGIVTRIDKKNKDLEVKPNTKCVIEDYEISTQGKIVKTKEETRLLKERLYRVFDPKSYPDDPMNGYK